MTNTIAPTAQFINTSQWTEALMATVFGMLFTWVGVALAVNALPIWLLLPAAMAGMVIMAPALAVSTVIVSILFQNILLAMTIDAVDTPLEFQAAQATNFVTLAVGGATAICLLLYQGRGRLRKMGRFIWPTLMFAVFLVPLAIYGAIRSDVSSALAYIRAFLIPGFGLALGLYASQRVTTGVFVRICALAATLVIAYCLLEALFPKDIYQDLGVASFYGWKNPDLMTWLDPEFLIQRRLRSWLNLTGVYRLDVAMPRLMGPTIHPISLAYASAFMAIVFAWKRWWIMVAIMLPLMLIVGAKGPLIMTVLVVGLYVLWRATRIDFVLQIAPVVFGIYVAVVFVYGLITRDLHVMGLMKGLTDFFSAPQGHGVGVGGNLNSEIRTTRDFLTYQRVGMPHAAESAFGVLIYQVGIFSLPLVAMFVLLFKELKCLARTAPETNLLWLTIIALACNALFQEEAFSPAGGGLLMLAIGLLMTARYNQERTWWF